MTKITLIGAGSVVFAKNLICDILQYPALSDAVISLMDIDGSRLAAAETLARRIVAQLGVKARIEASTDLRTALKGAKFAITTIQVGGYKPSTVVDFEIPAKYGVQQTIADTLGVGGVFRALRSIPELVKVARTLQEVGASEPVLLNYTNPMAMNMWAIDRMTGIKSVGLCHSVQGTSRQLASYCGLDYKDVSYLVAGINHMAYFLKFEYKGKDAYPLLFKALDDPSIFALDRVRFEMMRRLGYFVTESSEHHSEYVPYFIHHGQDVIKEFGIPINEYIRRCESILSTWARTEKELMDPNKPVQIQRSVEYGSTIIHSIVSGEPSVIYGNVPNTGLITNLTQGCSVEVPCLVDKQGIQPTHIGKLPPQLAALIHTNLNVQELTVEAAVMKKRDLIYQAVMMDPHTSTVLTLDKIWAMCDELIEQHQKDGYLGEFAPVAKNTGKPLADISRVFLSIEPDGVPFLGESTSSGFQLVANNQTDKAFSGTVEIGSSDPAVQFVGANQLQVEVAAGKTVYVPFTLGKAVGFDNDLTLSVLSSFPETIEQDLRLPKRDRIEIPVDGGQTALEIQWSGNTVAKNHLSLTSQKLLTETHVDDTDVKIDEGSYWEGSAVEVVLKDATTTTSKTCALVIFPDAKHPKVVRDGEIFPGAVVSVRGGKAGYDLSLEIDLKSAGITPKKPFLLELIYHVNALGTAHGKIRHAWQGSGNLKAEARFGLAIPVASKSPAKPSLAQTAELATV